MLYVFLFYQTTTTMSNIFLGGMEMSNIDIRKAITCSGLKFWQVAMEYGCTDSTFSRKLRHELSEVEKEKIFAIIKKLKAEAV